MIMPFGKYKGVELDEIIEDSPEYIVWLAENCELNGELSVIVNKNYKKCLKEVDQADAFCYSQEEEMRGLGIYLGEENVR